MSVHHDAACDSATGGHGSTKGEEVDADSPLAAPAYRIAAYLIDGTITASPPCILMMLALLPRDTASALALVATAALALIGLVVVQVVLLLRCGQTLGKRLLRLRILDKNGRRLGAFRVVAARGFLPAAVNLLPLTALIPAMTTAPVSRRAFEQVVAVSLAMILIDLAPILGGLRRTLHDRMAGSIVVRAPR